MSLELHIVGVVQGVGFRPFVYRLATELGLSGWVLNDGDGVWIEVEGPRELEFLERVQRDKPDAALIYAVDTRVLPGQGHQGFAIRRSQGGGPLRVWVLPDLATCPACHADVADPANRRHRYPFTNCTNCGPRFTILHDLPYDRALTTMRGFAMCPACQAEYDDPLDRRFHAQPNACPACGPQLALVVDGHTVATRDDALVDAARRLRDGDVLAVKGLGGYHLCALAQDEDAVARLRARKRRPTKPFALMYPDLATIRRDVEVPGFAEPLLTGAQAPIVLLPRTPASRAHIAPSVAPGAPSLGVFLPYTPLHRLLVDAVGGPIVATSGNATDDPTVHDDAVALAELAPLADAFLVHDRPIARQADDAVLQVLLRPEPAPQLLRRARGYAPLPVLAPRSLPPLVALGGQMNSTLALSRDKEILLSQHLGDLGAWAVRQSFDRALRDMTRLFGVTPEGVVCDAHPDYVTTHLADAMGLPVTRVQHHHAHLAAALLEHRLDRALGLCWDGTGYGDDGTIWGGEALLGTAAVSTRVGHLRPFRLPGGDRAIREPWRTAVALVHEAFDGDVPPLPWDAAPVVDLLEKDVRAPVTTSAGRLFDGVAALLGLCTHSTHQAHAPQAVEAAAWAHGEAPPLPIDVVDGVIDWRPTVRAIAAGGDPGARAAGFHMALVAAARATVRSIDPGDVVLTGGVFCNRYLTEALLEGLAADGVRAHAHHLLPPTDGSLSAGQLWAAAQGAFDA